MQNHILTNQTVVQRRELCSTIMHYIKPNPSLCVKQKLNYVFDNNFLRVTDFDNSNL